MKLYYTPGVCSLSPHIVLREAGYDFELVKVDLASRAVASGGVLKDINEKNYVPALQLDNGEFITEGIAITQYLADNKPETGLAPKTGTMERVRLNEWLAFITSELHKGFSPFFKPMGEEAKEFARNRLTTLFGIVAQRLEGKDYLLGNHFSIADAYLYVMLTWTRTIKLDLGQWPVLQQYAARIEQRPKVAEALQAEGLKPLSQ